VALAYRVTRKRLVALQLACLDAAAAVVLAVADGVADNVLCPLSATPVWPLCRRYFEAVQALLGPGLALEEGDGSTTAGGDAAAGGGSGSSAVAAGSP
jgi:hypothetical protein